MAVPFRTPDLAHPAAYPDPTDPARLCPAQRLDELAAILAAGVRRSLALRPKSLVQMPPESPGDGLDPPPVQSVHAARVVNATLDNGRRCT